MANEQDILAEYMGSNEPKKNTNNQEEFGGRKKVDHIPSKHESNFIELPTKDMPMGMFYPHGTHIEIRPATVAEIQAFSIVNDKNMYDVTTKINDMLKGCARVVTPDGKKHTYREIIEGDKQYIICQVSKYTMQNSKTLSIDAVCECNEEVKMELLPQNYEYYQPDEELLQYFDAVTRQFVFNLTNDQTVTLYPPTIGGQMDIYAYISSKVAKGVQPNIPFMKCMAWMLEPFKEYSIKEMERLEFEFGRMDMDSFEFINEAVEKMLFGIENLVKKCPKCGQEVRTPFTFPNGASSLFLRGDSFSRLLKK